MTNNNKQWKSYAEQLELLKSRGMDVGDERRALEFLKRVGYYRLSGYFYSFRNVAQSSGGALSRQDRFREGSQFDDVIDLYLFDRKLRLLTLDAIERIELAVQVEIAHLLGQRDVFAHENPDLLHPNFVRSAQNGGKTHYERWIDDYQRLVNRAKRKIFVRHNLDKYGHLPIWVAIEVWDFGALSKFYAGLRIQDKIAIESKFGLNEGKHLQTWLRGLNFLRNVSAHHSRLWNCNFVERASVPRSKHNLYRIENSRPFLYFCIMQEMLGVICPDSKWGQRFVSLTEQFPNVANGAVTLGDMGIIEGWHDWKIWR